MPRYLFRQCVCLVSAILLLGDLGHACTTVKEILKVQHERYYMLSRRGAPGKMTTAYYQAYIHNLIQFVNDIAPGTPEMGKVCMGLKAQQQFASLYDEHAVNKMIQYMHSLDQHMFYLPKSEYDDSHLLPLNDFQSKQVKWMWRLVSNELNLPTSKVSIRTMAKVPGGLAFFFDPVGSTVCDKFEAYVDGVLGTANALDVLYEVVALVIRLHLLGVPSRNSLQILRHHAAFTFNGIRCKRKHTFDLEMSRVFVPWYEEAFKTLTEGIDVSSVPQIPPSVIKTRLSKKIDVLAHYKGWGKLTYFRFNETTKRIQQTHIAERIFDPQVLKLIRNDVGIPKTSPGAIDHNGSPPAQVSAIVPFVERTTKCQSGYFSFMNPPTVSNAVCCPVICRNAHLLETVKKDFTTSSCCRSVRNGVSLYSSEFKQLSAVSIEPYGFRKSELIAIMV